MGAASQVVHQPEVLDEGEFLSLDDVIVRLDIGRTLAYSLARRQAFPFKVHRMGRIYRISKPEFYRAMHGEAAAEAIAS